MKSINKAIDLENEGKWGKAVHHLINMRSANSKSLEVNVRLIFLLWYILLELDDNEVILHKIDVEDKLRSFTKESLNYFREEPTYLFIIGYIILLSPWYFCDDIGEVEDKARKMLLRANKLDSNNDMYRWGYEMSVSGNFENAKNAAIKINENNNIMKLLRLNDGGIIHDYFSEVVSSSTDLQSN